MKSDIILQKDLELLNKDIKGRGSSCWLKAKMLLSASYFNISRRITVGKKKSAVAVINTSVLMEQTK